MTRGCFRLYETKIPKIGSGIFSTLYMLAKNDFEMQEF